MVVVAAGFVFVFVCKGLWVLCAVVGDCVAVGVCCGCVCLRLLWLLVVVIIDNFVVRLLCVLLLLLGRGLYSSLLDGWLCCRCCCGDDGYDV